MPVLSAKHRLAPVSRAIRRTKTAFHSAFARRILGEGAWVAGGQVLSIVGVLLGTRVLTEIVPPDIWGMTSLCLGLTYLASGVVGYPLGQVILRYYAQAARQGQLPELRATVQRLMRKPLATLTACALLAVVFLPQYFPASPLLICLSVGLLWCDSLRTIEVALLAAARRQRLFAIWSVLDRWTMPATAVLAVALWGPRPEMLFLGNLAATATVYLICRRHSRRLTFQGGFGDTGESDLGREMWLYALPLTPLVVVEWLNSMSGRYVLGWLVDLQSVGIYVAAFALASQPFLLCGRIVEVTLKPVYFQAIADGDPHRSRGVFRVWVLTMAAVCSVGVVLLTLCCRWVGAILLAEQYQVAVQYIPPIALGYALAAVASVYEARCQAGHRTSLILACRSVGAVGSLLATIPLTYCFGLAGAAVAPPLAFAVQLAFTVFVAGREHDLDYRPTGELSPTNL